VTSSPMSSPLRAVEFQSRSAWKGVVRATGLALGFLSLSGCPNRTPEGVRPAAAPVQSTEVRFESVGAKLGVKYRSPQLPDPLTILDAFGCGCAFLDYDGDGWQDLLLVAEPYPRLYQNLKGQRFTEVTAGSGLDLLRGAWKGCAVGDYDGDGRLDLLLTGYHCLALLRNAGGGRWEDRTAAAGIGPGKQWSSSAGFMDLDADGDLDLVLLNYVQFGKKEPHYCEPKPGIRAGCPPRFYPPQFPELWKNEGQGRFRNVSAAAGMKDASGTAQVLAFSDVDEDGDPDFYLGNDGVPADLMVNQGNLRFRNAGLESGVAYGTDGGALAAMSADWADYDRDGHLDLFVTAFSGEPYSLLRAVGKGNFQQQSEPTGIEALTRTPLGFGSRWLDFDNDGWPDLAVANGHVYNRTAELSAGTTFRQPLMLFRNVRGSRFEDLLPQMDAEVRTPLLGRGLASGDLDNDGREDLLVVNHGGAPLLLRNTSRSANHWITLDLRGKGGNRLAYGATVTGQAGDQTWVGQVSPASSYLSSSDPRVHFGLGEVARLESLTVRWPDGQQQVLRDLPVDGIIRITEGENAVNALARMPAGGVP